MGSEPTFQDQWVTKNPETHADEAQTIKRTAYCILTYDAPAVPCLITSPNNY